MLRLDRTPFELRDLCGAHIAQGSQQHDTLPFDFVALAGASNSATSSTHKPETSTDRARKMLEDVGL